MDSRRPPRRQARDLVLTFAGMVGFLLAIAGTGVAAGLLTGVPGLVLWVSVFVVVVMVAARNEGLL